MPAPLSEFRPRSAYELAEGAPLEVRIGGTGYFFRCRPLSILNYIRLWTAKETIIKGIEDATAAAKAETERAGPQRANLTKSQAVLFEYLFSVVKILWETTEKPKNPIRWIRFRAAFFTFFQTNLDAAHALLESALADSGRLLHFTEYPPEIRNDSGETVGGGDWFRTFTQGAPEGYGETWAACLSRREIEKEKTIASWMALKKGRESNGNGR